MQTYPECISCFLRQALVAACQAGAGEAVQKEILDEVLAAVHDFSPEIPPPQTARTIYRIVREKTGIGDPFKKLKQRSNSFALSLYPRLKKKVAICDDRLLAATEIAILGNVIDYGVQHSQKMETEVNTLLNEGLEHTRSAVFDYEHFSRDLRAAHRILYLADNAGEVVFDRVLIEELVHDGKEITFVVRGGPIINDALCEDAQACGIGTVARIITSGLDVPGTILRECTEELLEYYKTADVVISKGQGNYETLDDTSGTIYFLFKVKCPCVAMDIGCTIGSMVLKRNQKNTTTEGGRRD